MSLFSRFPRAIRKPKSITSSEVACLMHTHRLESTREQTQQKLAGNANASTYTSTDRLSEKSQFQTPGTGEDEQDVFILTVQTDKNFHDRMTELRSRYFPKRLNKLDAHLTLFHALPGSKLESTVIPHIEVVANSTHPFRIRASYVMRLKQGIAIEIRELEGGADVKDLRRQLKRPWKDQRILSQQDAGGGRPHYTIMNKVQDRDEVNRAFKEVKTSNEPVWGTATGLGLWRYEKGGAWRWVREFAFAGHGKEVDEVVL